MKTVKIACDVIFGILLVVVFVLVVVVVVVPRSMGGTSLTVLTGSMEPAIKPGDMVATRGITSHNENNLGIGSVIAFLPYPDDPTVVTHRIIAITTGNNGTSYTTKGDANNDVDPWGPVAASHVRGQVVYVIPKVGYLSQWITHNFPLAVTIAGLALIAYGIVTFGISFLHRRRDDPAPGRSADPVPGRAAGPTPSRAIGHVPSRAWQDDADDSTDNDQGLVLAGQAAPRRSLPDPYEETLRL